MDRNNLNDYPYFEDAHDDYGEARSDYRRASAPNPALEQPRYADYGAQAARMGRDYRNVLVYEPKKCSDVQTLIDYLRRKEPAIINLDGTDASTAQRILDFTSGAMYALGGSVLRISGNIFLLSPEGVGVTVPHEMDQK